MARVTPSPVDGPSADEIKAGLPMSGRIMGTLADALVQQVASRGLQRTTFIVSPTDCTSGPVSQTIRMLHRVGPLSRYLWAGFSYDADEATGAPAVTVTAYTLGGAVIDGPATWSRALGTLGLSPPAAGLVGSARMLSRDDWQSSERVDNPGISRPRLLDLDSYQGTDVEVRVSTTNVRIWDVILADDYSAEV